MNRLKTFILRWEEKPIGFGAYIVTILSVIFLRDMLETFVTDHAFAFVHPFHLVHVPIFYFSLLLILIVIAHLFSGVGLLEVSRLGLLAFPLICLPPVFNFWSSWIAGQEVSYSYIQQEAWFHFVHFFNPFIRLDIVPASIRMEVFMIVAGIAGYIQWRRRRWLFSVAGGLCAFAAIYFYAALPAIFMDVVVGLQPWLRVVLNAINRLYRGPVDPGMTREGAMDDPNLMILELIPLVLAAGIWMWRYDRVKFLALVKNFRLTRVAHYLSLATLGMLLYFHLTLNRDLFVFLRVAGVWLALFFACQFSAVINDLSDGVEDALTNKTRPVASGLFAAGEYAKVGWVYLTFSLLFAFWVGDYCFTGTLLFIVLYAMYSMPPLRLKRLMVASSVIIGLEAVVVFLIGQSCLTEDGVVAKEFVPLWGLIFLIFALSSSIKDLKDTSGDVAAGIGTLPVVLGPERARQVIAGMVFLGYVLCGAFLTWQPLYGLSRFFFAVSIGFAVGNFFYIKKSHSHETPVFLSYFVFLAVILFFFSIRP